MLSGKRVLLFAAALYEDLELWYPKIRLEEEGATCVVAGEHVKAGVRDSVIRDPGSGIRATRQV